MKKEKSKIDRRKLLQTAVIGAGAAGLKGTDAGQWIKPVISTAVVPAHASTSGEPICSSISLFFGTTEDTTSALETIDVNVEVPDFNFNDTFEVVFTTEGTAEIMGTFNGEVEDGNTTSQEDNMSIIFDGPALNQEVTAEIVFDNTGQFCGRAADSVGFE